MKGVLDKSLEINVVGIIRPSADSSASAISGAIGYTSDLTDYIIENVNSSEIVNQQKSDSDAASWLPPNKAFRCTYVARQISVKKRYSLWVTASEKTAMQKVLADCPNEPIFE